MSSDHVNAASVSINYTNKKATLKRGFF